MKREPTKEYRVAGAIIKMLREARPRGPIDPDERHLQIRTEHVTQLDIAKQIPIDVSTMSKIERGLLKIELDFIEKLTRILHLTPLQQYLLLAVSGLFAVALTNFLGLPSHIQDSFQHLDLNKKNVAELEVITRQKLQEACRAIYPRLSAEIGAGEAVTWMSSISKLNRLLNSGHRSQLDLVLGTVTVLITKAIPESSCSIYLFDVGHKPHKLIMRATSDSDLAHHPPPPITLNDGSIVGRAAKEGQRLLVSDPAGSYHLIMPVLAFHPRHQLLGVISTSSMHQFSEDEIEFLETICGLLATNYRPDINPKY